MASSFEKSVKGATKIKAAPPKSKYIEHILIATHSGEAGVAEIFRALQNRLRDSTWTVVLKSLITVHLMIREGSQDATLAYLAKHKNMLAISSFADVQTQGRNIRHYSNYLTERARAFRETKIDWVRGAEHRLEKLTVDKGLLRETEIVQHQITALLKCDVLDNEPDNEITITVFRMLVLDLLALFHVVNQGLINILSHFFEMSRPDAERAMEIYRNFTKQTDFVVGYLGTARQYEHQTRVEVPKLKHAPVNLGKQLEDYLMDPDFEVNRRQYLAEQEAKKGKNGGKPFPSKNESESKAAPKISAPAASKPQQSAPKPAQPAKGPDPDLIDFFGSIEQNQQPMAIQASFQQSPAPQFNSSNPFPVQQPVQYPQNGFVSAQPGFQDPNQFHQQQQQQQSPPQLQQSFNGGFSGQQPPQLQTSYTGAGFGGYTPQQNFQASNLAPIPQDTSVSFPQPNLQPPVAQATGAPQTTNPFRASMMMANTTGASGPAFTATAPAPSTLTRQSTNPFAKSASTLSPPQSFPQMPPVPEQQFQPQQQNTAPVRAMPTGTNPFARNASPQQSQQPQPTGLAPQPTANTNPFRQSQFVNTATGLGWQNNQQLIGGGLDQVETVPIFPRPAPQQPWQQ
ncbi:ANTH domain-containing protein [Xylogone sp. PMI_703]|nr:ANTH domain-containing protein [Xylogone sp. PMI_703]